MKKRFLCLFACLLLLFSAGCKYINKEAIVQDLKEQGQELLEGAVEQGQEKLKDLTNQGQDLLESFSNDSAAATPSPVTYGESYDAKAEVALYLHLFNELPPNYITKTEARALGWEGGSLESVAPGKSIGGDSFGNYEGLLPEKEGRTYTECDIDTLGASERGAKRIVFSNDGLIYYTDDHYASFTLLYE